MAYNFMAQFADDVAAGSKSLTIREHRKGRSRHARAGELVQLYTGMRTRHCRKLVTPDPICEVVRPILFLRKGPLDCAVVLNAVELTHDQLDYLIVADGFLSRSAFFDFHLGNHYEIEKIFIKWGFWND